jgi:hypothetical protein
MINDAAQYFARYIHDTWYRHLMMQEQRISSPTNIVLVCLHVLSHADQLNADPLMYFSHAQLNIGTLSDLYINARQNLLHLIWNTNRVYFAVVET